MGPCQPWAYEQWEGRSCIQNRGGKKLRLECPKVRVVSRRSWSHVVRGSAWPVRRCKFPPGTPCLKRSVSVDPNPLTGQTRMPQFSPGTNTRAKKGFCLLQRGVSQSAQIAITESLVPIDDSTSGGVQRRFNPHSPLSSQVRRSLPLRQRSAPFMTEPGIDISTTC